MARARNGQRRHARRAACDDAEARATIGPTIMTGAEPRRRSSPIRNFITNIDGLDIHFIHVKSKHPNALPVIITHGWPGSIIEQLKIIGPLTDPTAHGGSAADAFDVVIPSLPGYGFSGKPTAPGWVVPRIAQSVGRADEAARLHALRGPGRRLGQCNQRSNGAAATAQACLRSTPTCPRRCPRQFARHFRPDRRQQALRPTSSMPGISSRTSTRMASATR